jgi:hypothetical protein
MRFLTVIAFLAAAPVSAQDFSQCPAPLKPGNWMATVTDSVATVDLFAKGLSRRLNAPADNSGQPSELIVSCSNDFIINGVTPDGYRLSFEMSLEDWLAPIGPRYSGTDTVQGVNMEVELQLQSPTLGVSQSRINAHAYGRSLLATPAAIIQRAGDDGSHYACRCPSKLDDFIAEEIERAEEIRKLYANEAYRKRPQSLPEDIKWSQKIYDDVIATMAGQTDLSFEAAAATFATPAVAAETASTKAGEEVGKTGVLVAATTPSSGENCKTEFGNAHRFTCFPDIAYDATDANEAIHRKACKRYNTSLATDLDSIDRHADEEARSYAAEIAFLQSWTKNNCGN